MGGITNVGSDKLQFSISRSSIILLVVIGFLAVTVLFWAFLSANPIILFCASILIASFVFYFSRSKDRKQARKLHNA